MYSNKLKELRENSDIKQNRLCDILKVNVKAYSMYETEYEIIPIKHLNTLANYFNVSLDYIFSFSNTIHYSNYKIEIDSKLSGERLKKFRKEQKLTLKDLALVINCSYGTIAGYESGRYIIATPFLYTICKKYNISADYLLGKIDTPKYLNSSKK